VSQIVTPFRINSAGYVDATTDINQRMAMNVLTAVTTRLGERLMKGQYGSIFGDHVFDVITPAYALDPDQMLMEEASKAVSAYFPTVRLIDVLVEQSPRSPGEYRVTVQYALDTDKVDRTTTVTVTRDLLTGN